MSHNFVEKKLVEKIVALKGPILVLGASGFVGANLLRTLLKHRNDVFGTGHFLPNWRLQDINPRHLLAGNLLDLNHLENIFDDIKPQTIFNCTAYGAYSFQDEIELIYKTNVTFTVNLLELCYQRKINCIINAGSSSEYGDDAAAPLENSTLNANSHYAVTKATAANLVYYYGKKKDLRTANLRLYSIYGPYEDSSRLIPQIVLRGLKKEFTNFTDSEISRDFVYVDDACEAFINAAFYLTSDHFGESFNIGSGIKTTMSDIANLAKKVYNITAEPQFTYKQHKWDVKNWYANPSKAKEILHWQTTTNLEEGLNKMTEWTTQNLAIYNSKQTTKKPQNNFNTKYSISTVIACYKDGQAIPEMYERITKIANKLQIDYEIIFVNDNSPDNSEQVIAEISKKDSRVIGINHSRNFGSQSAFRSGMEIASKNACILLDGDLQDPPEMIEQFLEKWQAGYEVVYGRRINRDAPFYMRFFYKLFYRIFAKFSYIEIPKDAGDFALMDRKVVEVILKFPERDLFLRGVRAYAGFKQVGVNYVRPERKFGRTTNNLFKNIGWAKKGIFSFSYVPLNMLSAFGWLMLIASGILMTLQILTKLFFPQSAPPGVTTTLLLVTFFGSLNLFAISILGEYIAKIFEEVKGRPHFIRRSIIRHGITNSDHSKSH